MSEPTTRGLDLRFAGIRGRKLAKLWRYFLPQIASHWRLLAGAVTCGLGAVAMQLLRPWPLKLVFDRILLPTEIGRLKGSFFDGLSTDELLIVLCAGLLGIALLWGLFSYGQVFLTARAGQGLVFGLRERAHAHLQRLSLGFHQRRRKGDLLMRLTGDINVLRDMMVDALVQGVTALLLLGTMVAILLTMDWRLALVVVALLPPLAATTFRFSGRIREAAQRQRKQEGRIASAISETLHGVRLIQAFSGERVRDKLFQRGNRRSLRAGLRTTRLEASMARLIELLLAAGTAAVFWYGVRRVQTGALSAGDLLVFISYAHSSFKPLRRLARVSSRTAKAVVCAGRVRELLREPAAVRNRPGAKRLRRCAGAIEFACVRFAYPGGERVLNRVELTVQPGSFVGIVGPSGAGKSTLLALLLRLFDPQRGRIRLDGKDLRRYRLDSLRTQMAVVMQQPFLFGDTVRENIAFGRPGASEIEILRAARLAEAYRFIARLPEGIDTSIAEAGASLSAGQRQRLAIARAFLRQAPILLLDEPATGLDAAAERKVLSALDRLRTNRTTLMVSHKLSAVSAADQILVVRRGRVQERGDHASLVAAGGWYARTWCAQAAQFPEVAPDEPAAAASRRAG
ncbi:MAG: ABC transporter ATP-binding protein [Thermoanaerobaculia bacterium]